MFEIYRIRPSCAPNNEYKINRDEVWNVSRVETFDILTEAKRFVIEKNRLHSDLVKFEYTLKEEQIPDFLERFCFTDDKYLTDRRFFLGYPPIEKIKKALIKDGIKVL